MKTLVTLCLLAVCSPLFLTAQTLIESKSLSSPDLKEFFVTTSGGDITVESWEGESVEIELTLNQGSEDKLDEFNEKYTRSYSVENGRAVVEIKQKRKSKWELFSMFRSVSHTITMKVPKSLAFELVTSGGDVTISNLESSGSVRTSGGDIRVTEFKGVLTSSTSGGDVVLADVTGKINASTSGGDIALRNAGGVVDISTSGGDIKVTDFRGKLDASTSGGSIIVDVKKDCEGVRASTSGGDIRVSIPVQTSASLSAKTSGGKVSLTDDLDSGFKGTRKRDKIEGVLNGGGPEIHLRTSGGDIRIISQ